MYIVQEANTIRRLLPQDQPRVLLVTSAFRMRRAQVLFERQGLTVFPMRLIFRPSSPGLVPSGVTHCNGYPTPAAWMRVPELYGS